MATNVSAAVCASTTSCQFTLDQATTLGNGNYGTVTLTLLAGNTIRINIDLVAGDTLINTGAGGGAAFGFNENPFVGGLSYTSLTAGYSGGDTNTTAKDNGMDGQGSFDDNFGTTAPGNTSGLQHVAFTVTRSASPFTDVNQLVSLSGNPPGSQQSFFAADVCVGTPGCSGGTGVVGASGVIQGTPEPQYVSLLIAGFGCVALVERRRRNRLAGN